MPEISESQQQRIIIPVLIGGGAMALVSYVPILNLINCVFCAGIMGAAILGVWFYKKSYPRDMAFGPKQGAMIGALSGVVGALLYAALTLTWVSSSGPAFVEDFRTELESNASYLEAQGQDPEQVEQASEMIIEILQSPFMMFIIVLGAGLIIFALFGALGGAIGGKIFKSAPTEALSVPHDPDDF